ncbi:hypothetical protein VTJ04DRAFT_8216 [Mycothermus thermophilus]|uniref:uncharacterized protein n=1 Tax=Humicola insolens TaxID=85995 RepID=UPI00374357EA
MSVEIDPLELGFRRPFTVEVAETLKITNPNSLPVYFKVKTTAPKQYCVRPNSGRIEPGSTVEVSVLLQAMKAEPPLDAKCRDKFLVQSVLVTMERERETMAKIWEMVTKADIQEKKIRVSWLPPLNAGVPDAPAPVSTPSRPSTGTNGLVEATPDAPAYGSPGNDTTVLADDTTTFVATTETVTPAPPTPPTVSTTSPPGPAAADSYEDLKQQLAKAEATIASLRNEVNSGLRQRKVAEDAGSGEKAQLAQAERTATANAVAVPQGTTEGVPVQIVALLCLISFLLAYIFF